MPRLLKILMQQLSTLMLIQKKHEAFYLIKLILRNITMINQKQLIRDSLGLIK